MSKAAKIQTVELREIDVPELPRVPILNVPTFWVKKMGLKFGDKLSVCEDPVNGNLIISPKVKSPVAAADGPEAN